MTKGVWKATLLLVDGPQPVDMPDGAHVVHVGEQNGYPTLWFEVDAERRIVPRRFGVYGTGHLIPASATHVGSYVTPPFVWHIYECEAG